LCFVPVTKKVVGVFVRFRAPPCTVSASGQYGRQVSFEPPFRLDLRCLTLVRQCCTATLFVASTCSASQLSFFKPAAEVTPGPPIMMTQQACTQIFLI
jgi:hypothetical protein